MTISQVLPHFGREKHVEFRQVFFRRREKIPLDFAVAFINRQPVVADEPPSLVCLYILDHDTEKVPRGKVASVVVPDADLFQVAKRLRYSQEEGINGS